tara:strand:- start:296 stop:517 length:222 start_codon:yes stop_codon:yes gene_type:complete
MQMAEITIKYNGEDKVIDTDSLNEMQSGLMAEASVAEQEFNRYKYITAMCKDRRDFLLQKIVESLEEDDKKKT